MQKIRIIKISENEFEIPIQKEMKVPARLFISKEMLQELKKDKTIEQAMNMAKLPLISHVCVMPDAHQGYGACIGGVMASDATDGIVSPGAIGFDINCGVRVLTTNISVKEFMQKREKIMHDLKRTIPTGFNHQRNSLTKEQLTQIMLKGSSWCLENNFATKDDIDKTEDSGTIPNAKPEFVSKKAIERGLNQLGTLGSGNHFIDIHKIEKIFDTKTSQIFNLDSNNISIMIHCGSRGLGHQICSDYTREIEKIYPLEKFPDRELSYAPIKSEIGQKYLGAMRSAANFAFANRQLITHNIRKMLSFHFKNPQIKLLYDVAHNIAKEEIYTINNKPKILLIHRKGATRSFGPESKEIPKQYQKTGQPIIIPGSMATSSFILTGTNQAKEKTFSSTAHGAGRAHSRTYMKNNLTIENIKEKLKIQDIHLESSNKKGILEEWSEAYKDIDQVIKISNINGIGKPIASLKPLAVLIG